MSERSQISGVGDFDDRDRYECRLVLCPEDEGGFSVHALHLPGIVSQGESVDDCLENICDAFRAAIAVYREQGDDIPWQEQEIEIDPPKGAMYRWILVDV